MIVAKKGVSIVICTYNGSKRLPNVLNCIAKQRLSPGIEWELIVVDNASTDDTRNVVSSYWGQNGAASAGFSILDDPRPGVTNARNTGIRASKFECLIFCDDDNWLASDFAQKAYDLLEKDLKIGAIGSNGQAVADIPLPDWFEEYKDYYATGPQGKSSGDITNEKSFVYGAGSIFRKSALIFLSDNGFKNRMMSKTGKSLLTGEDNEYCYALVMAGYKIWYEESLHFEHFMPDQRLTLSYFSSLIKAYSYSSFLLFPYKMILKGEKRPTYKLSISWNLLVIVYFILLHDIPAIPFHIINGKPYKIRLRWMVRKGGLEATLKNPGYQQKLVQELETAGFKCIKQ